MTLKIKSDIGNRAYKFSLRVIKLSNFLPNKRSSWVIGDQVLRSAVSIGANIVEAQASSSRLEYKKFYEISLKSCLETIYWLNLLVDSSIVTEKNVGDLIKEAEEISNMLGRSVITLKKK